MKLATDVGGTFTDLAQFYIDEQSGIAEIRISKTQTTPGRYEDGILQAIDQAKADLGKQAFLIHGTTVVINALIERKIAKTALLTTLSLTLPPSKSG